jgi:class 3 adenylate cyclase
MASTRRLAAILAADMVGYSRVMGLDEAGTATALREHRAAADPLIAQQGGRIVRLPVTASSSSLGPWSASSNAPWRCNALAQKRAIALDSLENTIGHEEPFKMRKRDGDEGRGTPQSRTKRRAGSWHMS